MRWRQSFLAEVSQSLRQLGLKECPVCGLANSLNVGPLPALLVEGGLLAGTDDNSLAEDYDLVFAVRLECGACGYLMLFNAQRFRIADEKIIEPEEAERDNQFGE